MESRPEDFEAIRRILAEYCLFAEAGMGEAWAGLFAEDGVWDAGHVGRFVGRAAILDHYNEASMPKERHRVTNSVIGVHGDRAQALSSVTLYHSSREDGFKLVGGGFYADELVRQGGRWLFSRRRFLPKIKPEDLPPY